MELRELKYFLAVTREQSISKAAEALFYNATEFIPTDAKS